MADETTMAAYVAGIIDGEGHIGITRVKTALTIQIAVQITDSRITTLLQGRYGGRVAQRQRPGNCKPIFQWRVQARKAERVIREIRPYLIVKAEQADLALSVRDHLRDVGALSRGPNHDPTSERHLATIAFREAAKQRMHQLNKRGVN